MIESRLPQLHSHSSFYRRLFFSWRSFSHTNRNHEFQPYLKPYQVRQTLVSVQSIDSNPIFPLIDLCRDINSLKKIHAFLTVRGLTGDLLCDTKLVSSYGSLGFVGYARLLFDKMPEPDFYSWKVMMRWYLLNNLYKEIISFYYRMRMCLRELDDVIFSIVLKACTELRDSVEGKKVHCHMVKTGNSNSFVLTSLVDTYAKCGEIDRSRIIFNEITDKNVVTWTSMIAAYVKNDCAEEALILFGKMREAMVKGNQFTLGSLAASCASLGALHQGKWVHGYVIKTGIEFNPFLVTALLDMYVKCGALPHARAIFDELSFMDVVSWTAMIAGYTQNGRPDEALRLFIDKKWVGFLPNCVTVTSVLSACARSGSLNVGKLVHGLGIKLGLKDPTVVNALVDMYAKCGRTGDAQYIFERFSDKKVVSWNSIISGHSQSGSAYEALRLFLRMRSVESVSPDEITLVSVISASASLSTLQVGCSLHAYCLKIGFLSNNVYIGTALLNFYAKCGDAKSARTIFDGMEERNTVSWSAMIGGCGKQGDGVGSLMLFDDMLRENLVPNDVIITEVLSACSHTGMIGEGLKYFNLLCKDRNFTPTMKHYACVTDLLSRAGRLEEALHVIENIPVQPGVTVFGAFLHGCGLHSRFDLGETAIKKMLDLHPDEACYYVLVSNLYASDGRWSQVNRVRELMNQTGLNKFPGYSTMEMDIKFLPVQTQP